VAEGGKGNKFTGKKRAGISCYQETEDTHDEKGAKKQKHGGE